MGTPYLDGLMARHGRGLLTGAELVGALINNFMEADVEAALERISPDLGAQLQNVLLRVARGDAVFSDLGADARSAMKAFVGRKAWEPLKWKTEITLEQTLDFIRVRNVSVPADIRFILTEDVGGAGYSLIGGWIGPLTRRITWSSFYRGDYIPIAIHPMALEIRTVAIKTVIEALFLLEELSAKFREKIDFPLGDLAVAISPGSLDSSLHRAIRRANHWIQEQMV